MKDTYIDKTVILLTACLLMVFALNLKGEENDDLRATAETFVRQICEKDADAVLQSHPMTDEFKAVVVPNAAVITALAAEANRRFGQLGDVVQSEIVEHSDQGLRSVFLYYQGSKRPAKVWVTFSGTDITGLHWNIWTEGYTDRKGTFANISVMESLIWGFVLIPMIVMSLFLLNGKGAFLIASYNTMSKEEQAQYDEKALCRSTGRFLLWITCCTIFFAFSIHNEAMWLPLCAMGIMVASVFVFVIYANTGNRFRKEGEEKEKQEESFLDRTLYSRGGIFQRGIGWVGAIVVFGGLILAAFTPVLLFWGEEEPTVNITDNNIRISGMYGVKIDFTEITDISLMENTISSIGITWKTIGHATSSTHKGYFQSNIYGSVLLFSRTKSSPTIHIEREGKADVFLNLSDEEATRTLYNDLKTAFAR